MNMYVTIIQEAADYIEHHLTEPLSLARISAHFHFSEYHFSRLFKAMAGININTYITGRRLALAVSLIQETSRPVTDISYASGFQSPEVFSRNFKKFFGISASAFRSGSTLMQTPLQPLHIIPRTITNFHGTFSLKETYLYLQNVQIAGIAFKADESSELFSDNLNTLSTNFLQQSISDSGLKQDYFYSVVTCSSNTGVYDIFLGKEAVSDTHSWDTFSVTNGWYACFDYYGPMLSMRTTFTDDYYHWIITKEIDIRNMNIGMLCCFDARDQNRVTIFIPVNAPKSQQ